MDDEERVVEQGYRTVTQGPVSIDISQVPSPQPVQVQFQVEKLA